jgi:hypothetical protein
MIAYVERAALGVLALAATLAACGNGTNAPLRSPEIVVSPAVVAPQGPRARGWLSSEVTRSGNLIYVAAGGYARGSLTPFATYSQDLNYPLYPLVDSNGNLFVGNGGSGAIVEYRHGTTSVSRILQTAGVQVDGMDFDAKGDLYVAYRNGSGIGSIETFAPGSTQGKMLGMQLDQPQGLVIANSGVILAIETGAASRIDEFLPGSSTPQLEVAVSQTPVQLAITESESRLFVSTLNGPVYATDYPLIKPRLVQEVFGSSQGVALSNGQYF